MHVFIYSMIFFSACTVPDETVLERNAKKTEAGVVVSHWLLIITSWVLQLPPFVGFLGLYIAPF